MRHQSILAYARYRYLKLAGALTLAAIILYAWDRPPNGPYGGTWLGYTLGTIGALIIAWLLWFGVRKRQFGSTVGTLQAWLSAHVYFGTTLIVIVTLHAAFKVGWNVHTLAYVLMLLVIGSGFFGVYAYLRYPRIMTDNLGDDTLEMLLIKIADLDRQARESLALAAGQHQQSRTLFRPGNRDRRLMVAPAARNGARLSDRCRRRRGAEHRPQTRRRAVENQPPDLHAAAEKTGARGAGTPRRQAQGLDRYLAVRARAAVDRSVGRSRDPHRVGVLLLVS